MTEVPRARHWRFRVRDPELFPPPGPLAEELDLTLSTNALRHYMTFQRPEGYFMSAWHHVEFAMNRELDVTPDIREKYIDDARWLIGEVLTNKESPTNTRLEALTLATFIPVLTKRALNVDIIASDCNDVYKGLGNAMAYVSRETFSSWKMAETMVFALAARTGQPDLLLYPTSPREEHSPVSTENHDGYFLTDAGKIRLQQKMYATEKPYAEDINILEMVPILHNALNRAGYTGYEDPYDAFEYVLSAILAETQTGDAKEHEKALLDYLSRSVAARQRFSNPVAA